MKNRVKALAQLLGCKKKEIQEGYDSNVFEYEGGEYIEEVKDREGCVIETFYIYRIN